MTLPIVIRRRPIHRYLLLMETGFHIGCGEIERDSLAESTRTDGTGTIAMDKDDARSHDASATGVNSARLEAAVLAELRRRVGVPLAPGLYLVATPIGNLADVTLRALATLAHANVVYCEDTRHSRTLLAHFAIGTPLRPYHEHNAQAERPRILAQLAAGRAIALISDAGTPLISDPGYKLVRDVIDAGHSVTALPGASAVLCGLAIAGLPTDAFHFAGFLPPREGARRTRLKELAPIPGTLVLFEAPTRLADTLQDMAAVLGARQASVARELTKRFETVHRGTLPELAAWAVSETIKGEIVVMVAPAESVAADDALIITELQKRVAEMSMRDAVREVAEALDVPRSRVYDLGLALKDGAK